VEINPPTQDEKLVDGSPPPGKPPEGMAWIPGGEFWMGSAEPMFPDARPIHKVYVNGFWIDRTTVTNEQFAAFVKATGYLTAAERKADPALYPGAPAEMLEPGALADQLLEAFSH